MKRHITILTLLLLFLNGCQSYGKSNFDNRQIEDGVIDLSDYNFANNIIELDGEVLFYWKAFFRIDDINKQVLIPDTLFLSNSWNNQSNYKAKFSPEGFATYHFKVKISENEIGRQFILRPEHFISYASEIYINKKKVSHNGSVGKSREDENYKPQRNVNSFTFIADSTVLDVVIWVSNFDHFRGGVIRPINLGHAGNMNSSRESSITFDLVVIISLLIMFFHHVILYFVNKNEKASFFFSITCLVFAIDLSLQDSMSFFLFFPNANFSFYSVLQHITPFLIPSSFFYFLHALFPKVFPKTLRNLVGVIALSLTIFTLFSESELASVVVMPHYAYMLILILYVFYISVKAFLKKESGSQLFLIAYLIFALCAINDILNMFEIIQTTNLVSYGLVIFIFLLSILQGNRLSQMYHEIVKLSSNLKKLNIELEQKVEDRTVELDSSLKELEKLNQFQEDMSNMIVHDLKEPLSHIINIRDHIKDDMHVELVKQSGLKMLNLVENILDVSKYEKARMELSKQHISLVDLVSNLIKDIESQAKKKNISINTPVNIYCLVNIDKQIIYRVFVNILSNAIKFSPNNGLINISISRESENNIRVSISNQGPRIPQDRQGFIFERYNQVAKIENETIRSTGLGLAFSKMAVEAHGGRIGVISEENKEVVFWFTLPELCDFKILEDEPLNSEDKSLPLCNSDKADILKYALELRKLEIYEVSSILKVLNRIELKNNRIKIWSSEVRKSVQALNKEEYERLINL